MIFRMPDACDCKNCLERHSALCKYDIGAIDLPMLRTILKLFKRCLKA